jgi:type I restriction enzyme S subunit
MMFYKETNFKETSIGEVPKDWDIKKLGEIAQDDGIYYGLTAKAVVKETKLRMLRTTDIKNYSARWEDLPYCKITETRNNISKYFLRKGDLVVARAGTTGVSVLVDEDLDNIIFGSYLIKIRLKSGVYPKLIHYFFQSKSYWRHITSSQAGSTLRNINLPILKSIEIPLSSPSEQQKISKVLSTVDEAIQKTDEVIAKTGRLKRGLMQELLTKGIGHKEFKKTEIGEIPEEWEVVKIGNKNIATLIMGQSPPSSTYNEEGVGLPFLQGKAEFGEIYPSPVVYCSKPIKIAESNDILLSVRAPVGDVNIAPLNSCIGRGLSSIRAKSDKLHRLFLFYYLKFSSKRFESLSMGSTFKAIRKREIENYKIPLPPLPEQQKIASILSTVDEKIEIQRNEKTKLEKIKRGLMDLLLTGKIRVKTND